MRGCRGLGFGDTSQERDEDREARELPRDQSRSSLRFFVGPMTTHTPELEREYISGPFSKHPRRWYGRGAFDSSLDSLEPEGVRHGRQVSEVQGQAEEAGFEAEESAEERRHRQAKGACGEAGQISQWRLRSGPACPASGFMGWYRRGIIESGKAR